MKKNLIVKQDGYKECGAASLLSIIRYYHGNISINKLAELTHTDKTGTNFYYLKEAAEKIGLEAIGYKVTDNNSLSEINRPFICQLIDNHYEHFVVVYEITKHKVLMMDPAIGARTISLDDFFTSWTGYIMIFSTVKKLQFYQEKNFLNQLIIEIINQNKSIVFNILFLSIIFTIVSCLYATYFQVILDNIINTTKNNLRIVTFFFSVLLIIKCIASLFRTELLIYLNQKLDCSIFLNTFKKLLLLPYSYYKNRTTGEVISRINDLIYVKNILNKIILTVFLDFIIFIISGILLYTINNILFCLLVVIILIYLLIFYIFRPILKKYTEKNQKHSAEINSFLVESITGYETIKNINIETRTNQKMEQIYVQALNDRFIYENMSNLELFMKDIVSLIGILLIEFLGFHFVMDEKISLGTFLTFTLLANYFIEPIKNIIDLSKEYYYALNSLKRVNHLLDIDTEDLSTKTNFEIQGSIQIHSLSFSYNTQKKVLNEINLRIEHQEKVMILGDSGSGKSTIFKLLLKYYPINRDMIYLDEVDLNDFSIQNIRKNISSVSQNEILYTDTIKNNIILDRNISDQEFIEVCKIACVDEFVKNLFLGYETKLEENGLNLSGGERQRIILARMLLKPTKIMLIDEGLNAVDVNLERKILKNVFSKYTDKTIIIISHRVENLDLFTKVIHLEKGRIKEERNDQKGEIYA
ncbi:MAG: peptidase domain-containing ABC transporter [Erysipelotrichaceae bacterium]|nr:peptidase domain-containing ABC transporter [Erysipelotrichaceae bacterium]